MTGVQHKIVGTGFGVAAALAAYKSGVAEAPVLILTSMVGCMLPDMDHDKTKLGRKRKAVTTATSGLTNMVLYGGVILGSLLAIAMITGFVDYGIDIMTLVYGIAALGGLIFIRKVLTGSDIYKWATKHRGFMHTLAIPAVLYYTLGVSDAPLYYYSIMGLIVGYVSHLFADMLTIEGCPILFPLCRNNFRIMKLRTKDNTCTVAAWVVALGAVGLAYLFA